MTHTSPLYEQHGEIRGMCDALLALVSAATPPAPDVLARERWLLASAICRHMAAEDCIARQPLSASLDPRDREAVAEYNLGHNMLRKCLSEHNSRWSTAGILADLNGYRRDLSAQMQKLYAAMKWEERSFYPLANKAIVASAAATFIAESAKARADFLQGT